jgi:hypothetical protein
LPPKTSMRTREWSSAFWQLLRFMIDTISAAKRKVRVSLTSLRVERRRDEAKSADVRDQFPLSFNRPSWTHDTRPTARDEPCQRIVERQKIALNSLAASMCAFANFCWTSWKPARGFLNCFLW